MLILLVCESVEFTLWVKEYPGTQEILRSRTPWQCQHLAGLVLPFQSHLMSNKPGLPVCQEDSYSLVIFPYGISLGPALMSLSSLKPSPPLSAHPVLFLKYPSSGPVQALLPPDASLATLALFSKALPAHITHWLSLKASLSCWLL